MKIYLVGGAVRDTLLEHPFTERDWVVVGAAPEQLIELGYTPVGKDFPVFLHPDTKEEYALARTERKSGRGHTGFNCYSSPDVTLEEDLQRRDLTINAIAQDDNGKLIDTYHGQQDIQDKILRHVSDAFIEDPLRVLRVARFYARYKHLGFTIAEETLELMRTISASGELETLPAERIWKEFEKALTEHSPEAFLEALDTVTALAVLMPAFSPLQSGLLKSIKSAAEKHLSAAIRFACLFYSIDKENTRALVAQLKVPKQFSELALLVSQYSAICSNKNLSAYEQVKLFNHLDAFRREQRLMDFLSCCELLISDQKKISKLRHAFFAIKSINAKKYIKQGLAGKAIAEAINNERQQTLENL